jgi:transcriptional antiterminator NusG
MDTLGTKILARKLPIKALFHTDDLRGYIFIESELEDIERLIKNVPHIRGIISKEVKMEEIERFLLPEKSEIKVELGDIIEVTGGPFKGERAKVTRVDETKGEVTIELLEAVIPIPVTISTAAIRLYEKKKKD